MHGVVSLKIISVRSTVSCSPKIYSLLQ